MGPYLKYKYDRKQVPQYGPREVDAYLIGRAPNLFSIQKRVFWELLKKIENTELEYLSQPKSILDFGCGPGTGIWALSQVLNADKIERIMGVDISDEMLLCANKFIRSIESFKEKNSLKLLKYLPSLDATQNSAEETFDICLVGGVLSELPNDSAREIIVDALFKLTRGVLIVVEFGNPEGFRIVNNARKQVLGLEKNMDQNVANAFTLAPCPHDKRCPLEGSSKTWCHFKQRTELSPLLINIKQKNTNFEDQSYSYVILGKGSRPNSGKS